LVAVEGIEPSYPAYETSTLPLSYTAIVTILWKGQLDLNQRMSASETDALTGLGYAPTKEN
jgi:hypothetical protein